jgi:ubiquinone/menaquinone biosynthesis C-methylase UbiE
VHDLENIPYPFKDNTFDEIYTSMVLEHIKDLSKLIDELVRI